MATKTNKTPDTEEYNVDRVRLEGETDEQYRLRRSREGTRHRKPTHQGDIDARVEVIMDLLASGKPQWLIRRECKRMWAVNARTIDRYVNSARERMAVLTDRPRAQWRLDQLNRYLSVADDMEKRVADRLKAMERIDRILGLEQWGIGGPQRIEVSGPGGGAIQSAVAVLSIDLAAKLAEYQAALASSAKSNLIEHVATQETSK